MSFAGAERKGAGVGRGGPRGAWPCGVLPCVLRGEGCFTAVWLVAASADFLGSKKIFRIAGLIRDKMPPTFRYFPAVPLTSGHRGRCVAFFFFLVLGSDPGPSSLPFIIFLNVTVSP